MRTLCFLFALGAVVGVQMGFGATPDPCAEDGNFPCVAAGKTTDDIANTALAIMQERQAAIDNDAEGAVQQGWAVKLSQKNADGAVTYTYHPFGDQCKVFVQRAISSLGNVGLGRYYRDAYCNCGHEVLNPADVVRGDIIQISHDLKHEADADENHLHTAIVLENLGGGWFEVIESNWKRDQVIRTREGAERWNPQEYASKWPNWNAHFYRLAPLPVAGTPPPPSPPPPPPPATMVGQFEPDAAANPRISEAFRESYEGYRDPDTGFNKLGTNSEYPYVFRWGNTGVYVQMFRQPDAGKSRYGDGFTWLMYSPGQQWCNLLTSTFMATYFSVLGDVEYGVPLNNEYLWFGPTGLILPGGNIYLRQDFSLGKTLIAQLVAAGLPAEVRVIDTPAGPIHISLIGDVGAGGAFDPLTLTGWAVSNAQVYLRSTGGEELDQHGWRSWYVDGVERAVTYTPEATITGLTPGLTYRFSTVQFQNDEVVATSDELTLTLPPAEEFSLSATVRTANAVELSIINRRFPVVGSYRILRDGVQIGQLLGEAFGDFGLAYAITYTYQVIALTSSNLELGRSNTVSVTTAPQPAVPPPVEAQPTSIQLSVDRIELRASERGQASAPVLDQYGRPMLGLPVYFISANSSIASIDADWGTIIADREGRVDLHAELVADRNLWSPLLTLIVQRADWTPSVPPAWHVVGVSEPLALDSAGRHWSDPSHEAWVGGDSTTGVTLPHTFPRLHQYLMVQHFSGGVLPLDGFTWYLADGRLGVYFQTVHGCELWVNGARVGAWGNPYGYGTQPINLPSLGNSLSVPPVEITPYLQEGLNHLVLYVSSGFGWPELRHLEFVNLNGAPVQTVALPNLICRIPAAGEFTAQDLATVTVVVENPSPTACNASTLALSVDGIQVQTYRIPELAANASHQFDALLGQLLAGVHAVLAQADRASEVTESDEGDNLATLDLTVAPVRRADLVVSVSLPASGFIGELLPITITVPNLGNAASAPCLLNLGFGGTTEESTGDADVGPLQFIVPQLAPGEEATFTTSLRLFALDTFTLWADVDANAEVRESDEANNTASASFTIVPRPPNLVVSAVTVSPPSPTTTDLVHFLVTVPNTGQSPSAACQLTGFVDLGSTRWGDLPTLNVPALTEGASTTLDVVAGPFPVAATYTAVFTADSTNLVSEIKEDDNQKSISFTVIAFPPLASLPPPRYAFSRTQDYVTWSGQQYTSYNFTCLNWTDYPDVIFRSEASVVCGSPGASRTWVRMWAVSATGSKSYLYGFCRLGSAANLNLIWFGLPRGSLPPAQVCVTLTDEVVGTVLTSNLVAIPRPAANDVWDPADNTSSGAVAVSNPTATEQSHGPHGLSSTDYYDWFKVYLTSGRSVNFNTIGGTGDDYGELYSTAAGTTRVAYNDDSGGNLQFSLTYTPPATGWYYLRVRAYSVGRSCSYSLKYRNLGS